MTPSEYILRKSVVTQGRMSSTDWDLMDAAIKERAFVSSRVESVRFLDVCRSRIADLLENSRDADGALVSRARVVSDIMHAARDAGIARGTASLKDPGSYARANVIVDTNAGMAAGYVQAELANSHGARMAFPAQELLRFEDRERPRDWKSRWIAAGGKLYGDRMIALKEDPIWINISRFGQPYPPFDFNSGMGVEDVSYDEAVELYERYKQNILGVISDIGFVIHKDDAPETEKLDAGIDLVNHIHADNPTMPILMQSSQESMREVAENLGVGFVVKTSKTLTHDLSEYIGREFGFGDFVVTDPNTGEELLRASDLYGFEKIIKNISDRDFRRLSDKNYISRWLFARGLFALGKQLRPLTIHNDSELPEIRRINLEVIHDFRINQGVGVVAKFDPATYNDTIRFARLGNGSLGGKARGLAFLNHILVKYDMYDKYEDVRITVPRTLVITTEYFDRFIIDNGLQYVINSDISDEEILAEFVASTLPRDLIDNLKVFIHNIRKPLAVRSSSKLEDSYYQPFAGVYSTYMIPRTDNEDQQLRLLSKAIKSVYASIFYASSRSYITATANVISEEKMAIILQEICGSSDQGYYFPTLSGVARSVNFYPIGHEKAEDGIVKVAFGLGKAVVDGDQVLRFSPKYPKHVLQTSTVEQTMTETQKSMFALNLKPEKFTTSIDDAVNLERISIADCEKFRNLKHVVSTFDLENQRMVDSAYPTGPRFVTFAQMLKYKTFPLAEIVDELLEIARNEMKCGVEIEFAADIDRGGNTNKLPKFNVLQIRPISVDSRNVDVDWDEIDTEGALIKSESALGTGWIKGLTDVIYLKLDTFDTQKTVQMAHELAAMNNRMRSENLNYVLIGYGRWGSSIPSLGVPVQWGDISEAKVIVECSLENFRVDPSQGTHFFQNLTSFNAGYINVDPYSGRGDVFDYEALEKLPVIEETEFLRHVKFDRELEICIDGRNSKAFVK